MSHDKRFDLPVSGYRTAGPIHDGLEVGAFHHLNERPLEGHLRQLTRARRDPLTLFGHNPGDYLDTRRSVVAYSTTASGVTNLMHVATATAAGTGQAVRPGPSTASARRLAARRGGGRGR